MEKDDWLIPIGLILLISALAELQNPFSTIPPSELFLAGVGLLAGILLMGYGVVRILSRRRKSILPKEADLVIPRESA